MHSILFHRVLVGALAVVFMGIVAVFGTVLVQTYREMETMEEREAIMYEALADKRAIYEEREAYLNRLLKDPAFFEKVVRDRLGYSRQDEVVFRFEE